MRRILTALALAIAVTAHAQGTYPNKPVRVIVSFSPASATDIVARAVSDQLSVILGQRFVVENRTGAGGTIAMNMVATSPPDGYTVLVNSGAHTVVPAANATLPFDTVKDFSPVSSLAGMPAVLVVTPALNVKNPAELVTLGKSKPGALSYSSAGVGSSTHLLGEKFLSATGMKALHVPYKGSPEATLDVAGGRVNYTLMPTNAVQAFLKDNRLLALAVTTAKRSVYLPDVPTLREFGISESDYTIWIGMFLPSKTPAEITDRLHEAVIKALASDEVKARLAAVGMEPMPVTRAQFEKTVVDEIGENTRLMRAAGVKPQ